MRNVFSVLATPLYRTVSLVVLDDLQKVFTDYKTKYVFTISELVPKVKDAITSLKHIQVSDDIIELSISK